MKTQNLEVPNTRSSVVLPEDYGKDFDNAANSVLDDLCGG